MKMKVTDRRRVGLFEDGTPVIWDGHGDPARHKIEANWYEASRWSPVRSGIWFPLQTASRDLDRYTRYELNRRGEYLVKNSPLIRGLIERLVNLIIGTGLYPVPISGSAAFNQRAKLSWRRFCAQPCVDSKMTMGIYQRVVARGRLGHGECFTILTSNKDTGEAGIQGRESFQVTGEQSAGEYLPNAAPYSPLPGMIDADGIRLNVQGMPVSYKFRNVPVPLPAAYVVHHFTPRRFEQPRGETILSAAINTAQDVDDILALEKASVKDASGRKDIIKTASGEFDPEALRKLEFGAQSPMPLPLPADPISKNNYYRIAFGSEQVIMQKGDEYTPYKPDRPGSAWQGFMDFLSNTICLSTGLPPSLLLPVPIGGTDIRRDLEIAQRIISPWQEDMAGEFQRVWEYWIESEIEAGTITPAPEDWRAVRWQFPKSITVDRGRDAIQDRSDVQAGLMSHEEYHGRYGDDAQAYDRQVEKEVRERRYRIAGTPFQDPFEDADDYVRWLSLDYRATAAKGAPPDGAGAPETAPAPVPAKRDGG
jgi:capsid protein